MNLQNFKDANTKNLEEVNEKLTTLTGKKADAHKIEFRYHHTGQNLVTFQTF